MQNPSTYNYPVLVVCQLSTTILIQLMRILVTSSYAILNKFIIGEVVGWELVSTIYVENRCGVEKHPTKSIHRSTGWDPRRAATTRQESWGAEL